MRFAIAACFGLALLAGNTGCCLFCRPLFPCLHRHCGGGDECGMGCQRAPIFNWSHCGDPCDHCGDWAGQSIIARTGDSEHTMSMANGRSRSRSAMAGRVVPGSYREVAVADEPSGEIIEEQVVDEGPQAVAEAPPAKRIRSSKSRPRHQVVRVQRLE
jgi:hypothetical protein